MKNLKKVNFLKLIQYFNTEDSKKRTADKEKYGYNELTVEEDKQLALINYVLQECEILERFYRNQPKLEIKNVDDLKPENIKQEYICNGGTCTHGVCDKIGKIVGKFIYCDTGCTYSG